MPQVKPTSKAAILRAETADPNHGRCLILNCPKEWAVKPTHVYARENAQYRDQLENLEWSWGMRKGTLNYDTRQNIMFLSATMQTLYLEGKWALIPDEETVNHFFIDGAVKEREEWSELTEATLKYRILPLSDDMAKFALTRFNGGDITQEAFTTHLYPFSDFPELTSHVHPKFVLQHLSSVIRAGRRSDPYIRKLIRSSRVMRLISLLEFGWDEGAVPEWADEDPTYAPLHDSNSDGDCDPTSHRSGMDADSASDGDSVCTPPRHVWCPAYVYNIPAFQPKKRGLVNVGGEGDGSPAELKKRKTGSAECVDVEREEGWSKDAISEWARGCSSSPPPESDLKD